MEDKPRYSRTSDILDLLVLMQSRVQGVSLLEIQEQFSVSRRTAERMRDSIMLIIPQVEELPTNSREKRWGFQRGFMNEIINFTPEEIANLEKMKEFQAENGFEDKHKQAEADTDFESLIEKIFGEDHGEACKKLIRICG